MGETLLMFSRPWGWRDRSLLQSSCQDNEWGMILHPKEVRIQKIDSQVDRKVIYHYFSWILLFYFLRLLIIIISNKSLHVYTVYIIIYNYIYILSMSTLMNSWPSPNMGIQRPLDQRTQNHVDILKSINILWMTMGYNAIPIFSGCHPIFPST